MTEAQQTATFARGTDTGRGRTVGGSQPTTGLGWTVFAACAAVLIGVFEVIAGLVALTDSSYYHVSRSGLVIHWSYTVWGAIHLALDVLLVAAGFGLLVGDRWARRLGLACVALATLSALANFAFLAAYPVWGAILIILDVLLVYALVAHGSEAHY